jgi:cytochrome P450
VSPDELSVNDPDWFDTLYKSGRRDKWPKNSKANGSPGSIASTIHYAQHKARRSAITQFFSKQAVNNLESIIGAKVNQLTNGIEREFRQKGQVLNTGIAFTALTLDVISDYCFGQSWRCLERPDFAPEWKKTMTNLFEPVPVMRNFPWIMGFMQSLPDWVMAKMAPDMVIFAEAKNVSDLGHST